jgi:hypothetical protein
MRFGESITAESRVLYPKGHTNYPRFGVCLHVATVVLAREKLIKCDDFVGVFHRKPSMRD